MPAYNTLFEPTPWNVAGFSVWLVAGAAQQHVRPR